MRRDLQNFNDLENLAHVDETWSYACRDRHEYYLYDREDLSTRKVQHKAGLTKVVSLGVTVVAVQLQSQPQLIREA